MKRASLFLLVCAFLPVTAHAQLRTGTPPFGTLTGSPDIVNDANLNMHYTFPVLNKAGRGVPFNYDLGYDSSIWSPAGASGSQSWVYATNWGWNFQTAALIGYVTNAQIYDRVCYNSHRQVTGGEIQLGDWVYYDAFGTSHPFSGSTISEWGTCGSENTTLNATAIDASGYLLSATGSSVNSVTSAGGSVMKPPLNPVIGFGAGTATDRNGNQVTVSSSEVFTDTLDTTALTITGSGNPTSPLTYTYTAPSGASASYIVKYTAYTVKTNFGCSGIADYGPYSVNLVSEIDLPDIGSVPNDKYVFAYEATLGFSGDVTGRLASVTLPTGGKVTYTYSGGNNGITCADGTPATLTRATPDGTWTYAHAESGSAWTTTVTDPQGNKTTYNFQGIYQTMQQVYSGTSTLLKTVYTCYNGATPNCNGTSITLPITSAGTYTQWPSGLESEVVQDYNSSGLLTEEDDYDYGSGAPGGLLRKELVTYASLGNNIVDELSQVTIENGNGTVVAQTNYTYDQGSVMATSGTPQHVSVTGSRGNATTISYFVNSSASLAKTFTYYDTGNVDVATDVNGGTTTYNYASVTSTCGNAFPSSLSEAISGLSKSMTWNCTGGVETSAMDENGQTVSMAWSDGYYWRPASTKDQEGNQTNVAYYPDSSYPNTFAVVRSLLFNGSNSETSDYQYMDSLGRTYVDQHIQSPTASTLDSTSFARDSNGRLSSTSGPCAIGWAGTCSGPTTTQTYDALNRPLVTTDGGGGTVALSYTGNDTLQTLGPAPTGENTKRRQSEYNSIGQLTSVCEVTSLSGNGTCAQNTSATGYWTKYTNDVLGDLLTVTQNAQSSSTQSRTYTYDGLGRMTSETNPETGTKYYFYDTDPGTRGGANCSGTYDGNLVKRVDAAGNVTCYIYDYLHRVLSITYPYGPNSSNTPNKYFVYDSATVDGNAMANAKSRLAEAYTCTSSCSSKITDEGFNYTARGEVATVYESTPHSGGYYWVTQSYWPNGVPDLETNSLGNLPGITNGVDGEGRPYSVSAGTGANPVSSTTYNVASEVTQVNFGSGDNDAFQYDSNTFRMTQYQFNINGQSDTGKLGWNANWSLGSLDIADAFNSSDTQNCNYTHDDLARIASANCGSALSDTYTYDAFGNLTKSGTFSFQPGYNWQNNQMSSGASYDSDGNVLNDSLNTYAWDVEGRPTAIDGVGITYNALERMVEQNSSGSYTQIVWSPTGWKLGYMNGQTLLQGDVPLPARMVVAYNSNGILNYHHVDWLGSYRLASTPSRTVYYDGAYAPFGETYAQSGGSVDYSFTSQNEDTVSTVYDFLYREYGPQGRWPSPDPAGIAAANPANPQSWNRYAYVENNPLSATDRTGLLRCPYATWNCDITDGGGDGCTVDGAASPCNLANAIVQSGAGVECPNNNCEIGTAKPYQCVGDVCGYFSNQYVSTHEYEWDGVLYSASEWAQFIDQAIDAQRQALASAMLDAILQADPSSTVSWGYVYSNLSPDGVRGSNTDFAWTGDASLLSFIPGSDNGQGCEFTCRVGSIPSIHMNNGDIHLDSGNPMWGFGLGFLVHFTFDMLLGNINPSVP